MLLRYDGTNYTTTTLQLKLNFGYDSTRKTLTTHPIQSLADTMKKETTETTTTNVTTVTVDRFRFSCYAEPIF